MERELEVLCGGVKVQMNGFAERVVLNTLMGLLGSLRDVDPDSEIKITIGPKEKARSRQ